MPAIVGILFCSVILMCHFITCLVAPGVSLLELQSLGNKHGMLFKPIDNSFVCAQIPSGQYVRATQSLCDCGTPLGSLTAKHNQRGRAEGESSHGTAVAKLKKKGWSQAKIERWLGEKKTASERTSLQRANSRCRSQQLVSIRTDFSQC